MSTELRNEGQVQTVLAVGRAVSDYSAIMDSCWIRVQTWRLRRHTGCRKDLSGHALHFSRRAAVVKCLRRRWLVEVSGSQPTRPIATIEVSGV